jgi:NAD(P)-dependent dehydrogenase (short-subunit alcohol dehydrogenase family)
LSWSVRWSLDYPVAVVASSACRSHKPEPKPEPEPEIRVALTADGHSSSVLAQRPDVPFAAWASSKAALECLSRYWAMELALPHGLTSNVVALGPTLTDYHAHDPPEMLEELSQLPSAAKRLATPDDIAQIVVFLASDAGRWINGDVIQGNGGMQFS